MAELPLEYLDYGSEPLFSVEEQEQFVANLIDPLNDHVETHLTGRIDEALSDVH